MDTTITYPNNCDESNKKLDLHLQKITELQKLISKEEELILEYLKEENSNNNPQPFSMA